MTMVNWLYTFVTILCVKGIFYQAISKSSAAVLLFRQVNNCILKLNKQSSLHRVINRKEYKREFSYFSSFSYCYHYHFNSEKFFPFTFSLQITQEIPNTMAKIHDHASCKGLMLLPIIGTTIVQGTDTFNYNKYLWPKGISKICTLECGYDF